MLTELIQPGSADFARVERAVEACERHGPDCPVVLTVRQVRGLLDSLRHHEDQSEEIEDLKAERDDWEQQAAMSGVEAEKLKARLEASQERVKQLAKASNP